MRGYHFTVGGCSSCHMKLLILAPFDIGLFTKLDDHDHDIAQHWLWHARMTDPASGRYYVERSGSQNGIGFSLYLHRWLMSAPGGMYVDHINGDTLDNQRANLRVVTNSQNCSNRHKMHGRNTSGYYGVSWHKGAGKWICQIKINYENIYLGLFTDKISAALAYDQKAKELRGPITHLNFPEIP